MEGPKCDNPEKWFGTQTNFTICAQAVKSAEEDYAKNIFAWRDDVTGRQAKDEFWKRIAEHYGFKIDFNRDK